MEFYLLFWCFLIFFYEEMLIEVFKNQTSVNEKNKKWKMENFKMYTVSHFRSFQTF
jgi:hypothetical protein